MENKTYDTIIYEIGDIEKNGFLIYDLLFCSIILSRG